MWDTQNRINNCRFDSHPLCVTIIKLLKGTFHIGAMHLCINMLRVVGCTLFNFYNGYTKRVTIRWMPGLDDFWSPTLSPFVFRNTNANKYMGIAKIIPFDLQ